MTDRNEAELTDARLTELDRLMDGVAEQDRAAFEALYDLTSARVHALCLSLLGDRPEAEETLQQLYVALWRDRAQGYRATRLAPMTWLMTLARARAMARLQARDAVPQARLGGDTPEEQDEALAAALAQGTLNPPEMQAADARLAGEPVLAQRLRDWQERLALQAQDLTPVMPPARARQRIREELGHALPPFSEVLDARIRWWQRPMPLLAAIVAVVALVLVLAVPQVLGRGGGQGYQTQIVSQPAGLRVDFALRDDRIRVALQSGAAPVGRDWEIWWVPPDGAEPVSLGLVPRREGEETRDLPAGLELVRGVQIALSDEPRGGSPSGRATGPILAISALPPS